MMGFNFEPSVAGIAKGNAQNESSRDEDTLRAQIALVDAKIAFYEADIEQCNAESAELLAEAKEVARWYGSSFCNNRTIAEVSKELHDEVLNIKGKDVKLACIMDKCEAGTNKCFDELAEVTKSVQDAQKPDANVDTQAQKARIKELKAAVEARKTMIDEVGYGKGDDKRLDEQLKMARARLEELMIKGEKISDLKRQLKVEQERNADLKQNSWQKDADQSKKSLRRSRR